MTPTPGDEGGAKQVKEAMTGIVSVGVMTGDDKRSERQREVVRQLMTGDSGRCVQGDDKGGDMPGDM